MLNGPLAGEPAVLGNLTLAEVLADSYPVARVIAGALDRPGSGLGAHWRVAAAFRHSGLAEEIFNSLASPNPLNRAAACRLCGALRLSEAVPWIGDLLADSNPKVRGAATRSLGQLGGRRAVEILIESADTIPLCRLSIALSRAASDIDIAALIRNPPSTNAAVATVLACGLRRDTLRVLPLLGIAHDRRWPKQVRFAACKSLVMVGDVAATDDLGQLAIADPDPAVREVADRAHKRLVRKALRAKS